MAEGLHYVEVQGTQSNLCLNSCSDCPLGQATPAQSTALELLVLNFGRMVESHDGTLEKLTERELPMNDGELDEWAARFLQLTHSIEPTTVEVDNLIASARIVIGLTGCDNHFFDSGMYSKIHQI